MYSGIEGFGYGIEKAFQNPKLFNQNENIRESATTIGDKERRSIKLPKLSRKGLDDNHDTNKKNSSSQPTTKNGKGTRRKGNTHKRRGDVHPGSQTALCIGHSEIDPYASAVLRYHHPKTKNYGNARRIIPEQLPDFDLLTGGFPCQSFSIAGKRKGLEEARGNLFFEIARILRVKKPKNFILENVRGLFSVGITDENGKVIKGTKGFVFKIIITTLTELGYFVEWQCLNSVGFGLPQNRQRVYIVGHLGNGRSRKIFPFQNSDQEIDSKGKEHNISGTISTKNQSPQNQFDGSTTLVMPKEVDPEHSYPITTSYQKGQYGNSRGTLVSDMDLIQVGTIGKDSEATRVYDPEGIARTIKNGGGMGAKTGLYAVGLREARTKEAKNQRKKSYKEGKDHSPRRGKVILPREDDKIGCITASESADRLLAVRSVQIGQGKDSRAAQSGTQIGNKDEAFTLRASNPNGVLANTRIRRLTPIECERLQGFPPDFTKYGIFFGKPTKKDIKFRDTHPEFWKQQQEIHGGGEDDCPGNIGFPTL